MPQSGGARANTAGNQLETFAARRLDDSGYQLVPHRLFFPLREMEQPIYARQVETGTDIYGKRRLVDLILYHPRRWPHCLVIQCKWQASPGSVDQKFPFEVLSIQQGGYDTIILLDGGGYAPGARQWLLEQAGTNRLKDVFDQGEFARFASRGKL